MKLYDYENGGYGWVEISGVRYPSAAAFYKERHAFTEQVIDNELSSGAILENEIYKYFYEN